MARPRMMPLPIVIAGLEVAVAIQWDCFASLAMTIGNKKQRSRKNEHGFSRGKVSLADSPGRECKEKHREDSHSGEKTGPTR